MRICLIIAVVTTLAAVGRSADDSTVALKSKPFPLADVQLLDGPFKRAMDLNGTYLLSLEPDRLLSWFRKESGLAPRAQNYGGWESQGVAGHTLGHYLSACSLMYASTHDRRFLDRVKYIVEELAVCQRANGNGYLTAIPGGKKAFGEIAQGNIRAQGFNLNGIWVPWYTLHKELAGFIEAYKLCENPKALELATNLANWAATTTKTLTDEQWQKMLVCEHGGMNEALAELYSITGNTNYLALAQKFYHRAILDPLSRRADELDGKHSNMQIPKVIGMARLHELTGTPGDAQIAQFFWERVALHRSFAFGGHGDHEHFFPTNQFADHLSTDTAETCCTYNMLKLTRHLFEWSADAREMDFYERALYNDILASQDPRRGMFVYLMPTKPGHFKTYSTPDDSFWCCVGTGMENHAKYGDTIYFHNEDTLFVNLFIPSELTWREKGLAVRQETEFPERDTTVLKFKTDKPKDLAVRIRRPAWATEGMMVSINGKTQPIDSNPGSYITLRREWRNNDKAEVRLPMSLHSEPLTGNSNMVALLYGPLVLAGELGTNGMPDSYARNQTDYSTLPAPSVPAFVCDVQELPAHLAPVSAGSLKFRTRGIGWPDDVTLIPLYQLHHERYSIYWTLFSEKEWEVHKSELAAAEQRRIALEARTIDMVRSGEQQSEVDHQVHGEKSDPLEALGRKLRHAVDGGWFSYDLKVDGGHSNELVCTWWGDESGERSFDILINGTRIASERLLHNRPGKFWDATYVIPVEFTRGKEKVTVKFQAQPGNFAGGVFGCRMLKTSE